MKLSVIVPAYNVEKVLPTCLKSVRKSNYRSFELIVVDDGSNDHTAQIAHRYADRVVSHKKNLSRIQARDTGLKASHGDIVVFIDSDIVLRRDTLEKVVRFFDSHPSTNVLTGLLSDRHFNHDFYSQYKNLYMNYIFRQLPERVTFIFGSIFAFRRSTVSGMVEGFAKGEDTALGQDLFQKGEEIFFSKDLEVIHLKKYSFMSWIKNDFEIPFNWASIFIAYHGWRQLGRNKVGFAHSPKTQLLSIALVPVIFHVLIGAITMQHSLYYLASVGAIWLGLNVGFFSYLFRKKGMAFGLLSVIATFLDHSVMLTGILAGFFSQSFKHAPVRG